MRISDWSSDVCSSDLVERKPAAVWQNKGKLALIDVNGKVLQPVNVSAMPDLPLVVGPNANQQTAELNALMEAAPALKPMLAGATWVGNRRWDRSEEHTSELQSLMRISYAVFCLKQKKITSTHKQQIS